MPDNNAQDQPPEDVEVTCAGGVSLPALGASNAPPDDQE